LNRATLELKHTLAFDAPVDDIALNRTTLELKQGRRVLASGKGLL